MYLPTIWQAGGQIATQNGDTWKSRAQLARGGEGDRLLRVLLQGRARPEGRRRLGGARRADRVHQRRRGDADRRRLDLQLDHRHQAGAGEEDRHRARRPPARRGKDTAFAGGSHLVQFQESKNKDLGAAFIDFMLEPAQLNKFTSEIGFLPGTTEGIKASGYLEDPQRKPFAEQLLDHSRGLPAVAEVGRPGGREHLRRRDPEGDEGPGDVAAGGGRARQEDGRGVRRVSTGAGSRRRGARSARPAAARDAARARSPGSRCRCCCCCRR